MGASAVPDEALNDYVPVLMLLLFAVSFAAINLLASWALGKRAPTNPDKDSAFECGMAPLEQGRRRFSVRFYVVAMLFILFDIEAAFLFPWAATFRQFAENRLFVLAEMGVFLGILIVGFVYVWNRGALEWE